MSRAVGFFELPGPRWVFDSDRQWEPEYATLCRQLDPWCRPAVHKQ